MARAEQKEQADRSRAKNGREEVHQPQIVDIRQGKRSKLCPSIT